jgi:hypothetical protein
MTKRSRVSALMILSWVLLSSVPAVLRSEAAERVSHDDLVADVKRLAWILEDAHPAPYERGGGVEAFHERLRGILDGIPEEGMTVAEFRRHLVPFVAAIGDAHTRLFHSDDAFDWYHPGGVPIVFGVVGEGLVVGAVPREEDRHLIGSRLVDVQGVPVAELCRRSDRLRPSENVYGSLLQLGMTGPLFCGDDLAEILPEWTDRTSIAITLLTPEDETMQLAYDLPYEMSYPLIQNQSTIVLPPTDRCDFAWSFMDDSGEVALLEVVGMMQYREALEIWEHAGVERRREDGRQAYMRFHGTEPPADYAEVVAGVPSATEVFSELVVAMKEAGTKTLLVDLRRNNGGNSYMSNILVYFLYGSDKLLHLRPKLEIEKYSEYYFEQYPDESIEAVNKGRAVPLAVGDCDTIENPRLGVTEELIQARLKELRRMDTFAAELETHAYDGYYLPENVIVLVSPYTFSSGYTMMRYLYWCGAKLAGTPSGQAGNCFGDVLEFTLPNSGLTGTVSHKRFADYPDNPALGRVTPMDCPLTYAKWLECGLDLNAAVMLGLDCAR